MDRIIRRGKGGHQAASVLELFYDLVFVFTITQVSHLLLEHLTWKGAIQATILLLGAWWSWNYTTWFTNEVDPQSPWVRIFMIALMLLSLIMAVALPEAFGDRALLFACAYVAIQIGRHGFLAFIAADRGTLERERAQRILTWFIVAGAFWIGGAFTDGWTQITLWIIALAFDYGAPLVTFWVPGRPRLTGSSWNVNPEHFNERFQLFIILTLGETIMITGNTTSALELDTPRMIAFTIAFLGTAALWWLYFSSGAEYADQYLEHASNPTVLARDVYTYAHVALVAGIIVSAVGDEFIIAHPDHHLTHAQLVVVIFGPMLYLLTEIYVSWRMAHIVSWTRIAGVVALVVVGIIGLSVSAVVTGGLALLVLILVIVANALIPSQHFGPHPAHTQEHFAA